MAKYNNKNYVIKVNPKLIVGVVNRWENAMPGMAMEEAVEFITATNKMQRARTVFELTEATDALIAEMADLEISMAALREMYGIPAGRINEAINKKLHKKK